MGIIWRLILCFLPLGLTPLFALLIGEGYLNFGGGEKDLLLLIPWIMWSLIFAVMFIVYWVKKKTLKATLLFALGGATALMCLIWAGLFLFSASELGLQ